MAERYGAKITVPGLARGAMPTRNTLQNGATGSVETPIETSPETRFETGFVAVVDRARPPVLGLDVEVDVRGLSRESEL